MLSFVTGLLAAGIIPSALGPHVEIDLPVFNTRVAPDGFEREYVDNYLSL